MLRCPSPERGGEASGEGGGGGGGRGGGGGDIVETRGRFGFCRSQTRAAGKVWDFQHLNGNPAESHLARPLRDTSSGRPNGNYDHTRLQRRRRAAGQKLVLPGSGSWHLLFGGARGGGGGGRGAISTFSASVTVVVRAAEAGAVNGEYCVRTHTVQHAPAPYGVHASMQTYLCLPPECSAPASHARRYMGRCGAACRVYIVAAAESRWSSPPEAPAPSRKRPASSGHWPRARTGTLRRRERPSHRLSVSRGGQSRQERSAPGWAQARAVIVARPCGPDSASRPWLLGRVMAMLRPETSARPPPRSSNGHGLCSPRHMA